MQLRDDGGSLSDCCSNPFHRTATYVTNGKNPLDTGLER